MDITKESPVILSFYTGLRGLERGLERVFGDIIIAAYVEIEAFCIWNLVAQMEQGVVAPAAIWTDDTTFPAQEFYGKVHIITGGYPCQPFSTAGLRGGTNDPRHRWPHLKRSVKTIRPICCFFENVTGHLSLGFDTVKRELEELGYKVQAGIYSAEEVGAPHQRKRLFILAILADSNCNGYRTEAGATGDKSKTNEGAPQRPYREWLRSVVRYSSTKMAHTKSFGVAQGCKEYETKQSNKDGGYGSNKQSLADSDGQGLEGQWHGDIFTSKEISLPTSRGDNNFPAGRGEEQFDWEAPLVIESGLGCTIDGYNFRADLLRALGNGVVEQTAELAFMDLLKKHGIWT